LSTAGVLPGQGPSSKGQHNFFVAQEVILLEMFETETGTAGRVDLDNAG
jgi:hypothetical protein